MIYKVRDIVCIRKEKGLYTPYVFNNAGTKLKNIFTNEIIELKKNYYESYHIEQWLDSNRYTIFDVLPTKSNVRHEAASSLKDLFTETPFSVIWEFTHQNLIGTINSGCNRYDNEHVVIDDKTVISFVKACNRHLKRELSVTDKQETINTNFAEETESAQEF